MKKFKTLFFVMILLLTPASLMAQTPSDDSNVPAASAVKRVEMYESAASQLGQTTSLAVSPLLAMLIHGFSYHLGSRADASTPWFASLYFLGPLGLLLLAIAVKDVIPVPGAVKTPLNALEELLAPGSGLAAFMAGLPSLLEFFAPAAGAAAAAVWPYLPTGVAWADAGTAAELAAAPPAGLISMLSGFLAALAGGAIFAAVWVVSNAATVLCLVVPGFIGAILKSGRAALGAALYGLGAIHPGLGLAAALLVIFISFLVARKAFRFTVWGFIFAWDLLGRRWRKTPRPEKALAFGGGGAKRMFGIPKRCLGFLEFTPEGPVFVWRRWLLFPTRVLLTGDLVVGRCLSWPILAGHDQNGRLREWISFPLRLRGHEEFLRQAAGAGEIRDLGLKGQAAKGWARIKALCSSKAEDCEPVSA
ncbi:MAG: hypothetical protein LBS31_11950 [Candidatus Adiutrix sp.]|jgi:hypothetical protein|nr:hypothetical protein [Candidatus Adiutrix sp.]